MIIKEKILNNVCLTAHPIGCREEVRRQINLAKQTTNDRFKGKNALIIGSSMGYGLASRIALAISGGAKTLGVSFERPADLAKKRTASPGWYNNQALELLFQENNLYAKTIIGDAFSDEIKAQTIETIRNEIGKIDIIIYSLASPLRIDPKTKITYRSVLKAIGKDLNVRTIDPFSATFKTVSVPQANEEEIESTIKVMGGEDWYLWIEALSKANLLNSDFMTFAYSYIGPPLTQDIYMNGTIGQAKQDLHATVDKINTLSSPLSGKAYISVNKAIVSRASSVIPILPLYLTVLYHVMKKHGLHETAIEQMLRLFNEKISDKHLELDEHNMIRLDDWEMKAVIQQEVEEIFLKIDESNIEQWADLKGFKQEFSAVHGFDLAGVDYTQDLEI